MSDQDSGNYPGVNIAALEELNKHIEELGFYERERTKLQAQVDQEVEAVKRKYSERIDQLNKGVADKKEAVTTTYLNRVLDVAKNKDDVITLRLRAGTIEMRTNPEALKQDDADELLSWARRLGILRLISEWKRTISINSLKALLKKRPNLRKSLKGAHFEQGRTLRIKPSKTNIELVQEMEPLRVKL